MLGSILAPPIFGNYHVGTYALQVVSERGILNRDYIRD